MGELGVFDGSKMKPSAFQYVRPGWHKFEITDARTSEQDGVSVEIDVVATTGPDKGNKQQIKIWDNALFILGGLMVACGIKLPETNFKLKSENLIGKKFYAQTDDRYKKGEDATTGKPYTNFSRFELVTFTPPTAAAKETAAEAPAAPAKAGVAKPAAKPAAAEADGIEEISEDDLG